MSHAQHLFNLLGHSSTLDICFLRYRVYEALGFIWRLLLDEESEWQATHAFPMASACVLLDFDARKVTITTPMYLVYNKEATNRGTSESIPRKILNASA